MNKMTGLYIWFVLLAIALVLASCGLEISAYTPTPTPLYIHYTPSKESNIHLEFDYPNSWFFSEDRIQDTDIVVIGLSDTQLLTVPTRAPNEPHGTPSDFGRVSIYIEPIKSNQTLDVLVEPYKQGHNNTSWIKALDDYQITIDGYSASVLEYQIEPIDNNGFISLMFERNTFFIIKDQIYQITFSVAEKDRGGEFEKGYEYFFKSLKIVP